MPQELDVANKRLCRKCGLHDGQIFARQDFLCEYVCCSESITLA